MQEFTKRNADRKVAARTIKEIRVRLGCTQEEFADIIGVQKQNIKLWEDAACLPNKKRIIKICEVGRINPNELLHGCKVNLDNLVGIFLDLPPKKQREFLERIIAEGKKKEQKR